MRKNILFFIKKFRKTYQVRKAIKKFEQTGISTEKDFQNFRQLFILSKGNFNDKLSKEINTKLGKDPGIKSEGVLGNLTNVEIEEIAEKIRENGYFIFKKKLPLEIVEEIKNFALKEPAHFLDVETNQVATKKINFDPYNICSPRYDFPRNSIFKSRHLQELIFDVSLLKVAQEYLGCRPVLDHLALWWSAPYYGKGLSKAAQMYHFDMDRIKFIKFFFYLTDVTLKTGPHCYVKGSHKKLPAEINRDGRFSDDFIENLYGKNKCVEILGKEGTIIAVDTRGFHKGKELLENSRLLFQIEFANSMFGRNYDPIPRSLLKEDKIQMSEMYFFKSLFSNEKA